MCIIYAPFSYIPGWKGSQDKRNMFTGCKELNGGDCETVFTSELRCWKITSSSEDTKSAISGVGATISRVLQTPLYSADQTGRNLGASKVDYQCIGKAFP